MVDYVNSEELRKFFSLVEFGPDSPKLLFDTALHLIQHQTKVRNNNIYSFIILHIQIFTLSTFKVDENKAKRYACRW